METSQTIKKTMLLLETLAEQKECGASHITRVLGVHRSTSYRMLQSLVQLGYVDHQEKTGLYQISAKLETLIHPDASFGWLINLAEPYMTELHSRFNETLHLAILQNDELYYLKKWESSRTLRVVIQSRAGGYAPLHCTGLGKVLLSGLDDELLDQKIPAGPLVRFTDTTITDPVRLREELAVIRKQRYSFDNQEHEMGICCVAVPLLDVREKVVAAISITVPQVRFTRERKNEFLEAMKVTGSAVSREIMAGNLLK